MTDDIDARLAAAVTDARDYAGLALTPNERDAAIDRFGRLCWLAGQREFHDQGRARGWRTAHEVLEAQIEALIGGER